MKLINGAMYRRHGGIGWEFVLVFLGDDKMGYGMLHISRHIDDSLSCPGFQQNKEGEFSFTEEELKEQWDSDKWVMIDGRLTIEKRDECWVGEYNKFEDYI